MRRLKPMSQFRALVARCEDYSGSREPENRPRVALVLFGVALVIGMALSWLAGVAP